MKEEIKGETKCEMERKPTLLNVLDILAKACPHMLDVDYIREMLDNEDQDTIKSSLSCLNKKVEKKTEEKVLEHVASWLRDRRMGRDVKIFMVLCVLSIMGFLGVLVYPSPLIPFLSLGHVPIFVVWGITACYFIIITQRYGWGDGSKRLYRRQFWGQLCRRGGRSRKPTRQINKPHT